MQYKIVTKKEKDIQTTLKIPGSRLTLSTREWFTYGMFRLEYKIGGGGGVKPQ